MDKVNKLPQISDIKQYISVYTNTLASDFVLSFLDMVEILQHGGAQIVIPIKSELVHIM